MTTSKYTFALTTSTTSGLLTLKIFQCSSQKRIQLASPANLALMPNSILLLRFTKSTTLSHSVFHTSQPSFSTKLRWPYKLRGLGPAHAGPWPKFLTWYNYPNTRGQSLAKRKTRHLQGSETIRRPRIYFLVCDGGQKGRGLWDPLFFISNLI